MTDRLTIWLPNSHVRHHDHAKVSRTASPLLVDELVFRVRVLLSFVAPELVVTAWVKKRPGQLFDEPVFVEELVDASSWAAEDHVHDRLGGTTSALPKSEANLGGKGSVCVVVVFLSRPR